MPAFSSDANVYLADLGETVVSGATTGLGILDQPGIIEEDGIAVVSTDYRLTCLTSLFGNVVYNTQVTVANVQYRVRDVRQLDDGLFCQIMLSKV
jgi:hypothetical protein